MKIPHQLRNLLLYTVRHFWLVRNERLYKRRFSMFSRLYVERVWMVRPHVIPIPTRHSPTTVNNTNSHYSLHWCPMGTATTKVVKSWIVTRIVFQFLGSNRILNRESQIHGKFYYRWTFEFLHLSRIFNKDKLIINI